MADTDDEQEKLDELDEAQQRADERTAHDLRELDDIRARHAELDASADVARALKLSDREVEDSARYRRLAAQNEQQAAEEAAKGDQLLAKAAADPATLDAMVDEADGRGHLRESGVHAEMAEAARHRAAWHAAEGAANRRDAAPEQPPPVEAVQRPPQEPPVAQQPQQRRLVRKKAKRALPGETLDLSMDRDLSG